MDAGSNLSKGFMDDEEEDDGFGRRDGAGQKGLLLRTQDFLQPLDDRQRREEERPPDINEPVEHALPDGISTYSIGRVSTACSSRITFVKSEWGVEKEPALSVSTAASSDVSAFAGAGFALWEEGLSGERGLKEITVRVDGKNEQKPSTPRSKHSATEQRRRSKINDRFQILRELIPHSDQKRDKASFLLEVIEYIRFLQERVQKYESEFPGWNQDATNMMPWVKVFFRSFWENARRNSQTPMDAVGDPSPAIKNGHIPVSFIKSSEVAVPNAAVIHRNSQAPLEPEFVTTIISGKAARGAVPAQEIGVAAGYTQPQQRLNPEAENMAYQSPSQCLRSDVGSGQTLDQDLTIDEGTISISSTYSQGVMNALAQSLQSSGIDLAQASISVQINLGRRAFNKPASVATERNSPHNNQTIGQSRSGSSGDESDRANKRQKPAGVSQ